MKINIISEWTAKIGEVAMSSPAFEAVVRFNPTDQQTRFIKVPRHARPVSARKCFPESDQFFSWRRKKGNRMTVAIRVRMAAKLMGETSRIANLAKG